MALSVTNLVVLRCCQENYKVWDKSACIDQYLPWVDFAIGVILCLIGGLALHGFLPVSGSLLIAIGASQMLIALTLKCLLCCKLTHHATHTFIHRRADENEGEGFYGFMGRMV